MKKILIILALSSLLFAERQTALDTLLWGRGFTTQDNQFHFNKDTGLFFCTTVNTIINIYPDVNDSQRPPIMWYNNSGQQVLIPIAQARAYMGEIYTTLAPAMLRKFGGE